MRLDNSILLAISRVLKNSILSVLREINISKIRKESNFISRFYCQVKERCIKKELKWKFNEAKILDIISNLVFK